MSKIICEICGTVYPENATVCPICGCPRTADAETELTAEEAVAAGAVRNTQRVKGGRFSNKNVKKRNQAAASGAPVRKVEKKEKEPKEKNNRGLVITVVILLLAVILLGVYIGARFFGGQGTAKETLPTETTTAATAAPTTVPEETDAACTDLNIAGIDLEKGVQLKGEGRAWRMAVTAVPENTTDKIEYASSNEGVVKVVINGNRVDLVSVAPGTATVTVTCGAVSKQFDVVCEFEETTEATEETTETSETTEETTEPEETGKLSLNLTDFTLFSEGEVATITPGKGISPAQCTWTSKDESVATVDNGKVTAVAPGLTDVVVEFNGQKATCIVRCNWTEETDPTEETEETTETTGSTESTEATEGDGTEWVISHSDVTITVGESFSIRLSSSGGETADVSWNSSNGNASVSGSTVTGEQVGTSYVTCTYNGVTYQCIVRVK